MLFHRFHWISVIYESYVARDKQLYNHNNDDDEQKECSASLPAGAQHTTVSLESWEAFV